MTRMILSSHILATRYLQKKWSKAHNGNMPPLELRRGVVETVLVVGFTKAVVDDLLKGWYAAHPAE